MSCCTTQILLYKYKLTFHMSNLMFLMDGWMDSEAMAQCELLLTAPTRNILTYLLI